MATIVNDRDVLMQATVPRVISGGASQNSAVVYIYQRSASATPPALPSSACTYSIATGVLTGLDNGWSATFPSGADKYLYVAMVMVFSSGATATIPASPAAGSWNAPQLLSANGDNGVASYVTLSQPSLVFTRANSSSAFAPASITLTATPFGGSATYSWSYWTGAAWSELAGSGNTYAVGSGDFTNARTFRVSAVIGGVTHTDEVTLAQLTGGLDGIASITGLLTNPAATLAADSSGDIYNFSTAGGTFKVWAGTDDKTGAAGPVTYATGPLTGCTASINVSTGVYSVTAMSAESATAVFTATYGGVTIPLTLSLSKARAGSQGPTGTGTPGSQGASYRTAYLASSVSSPSTSPSPQVDSGSTLTPGGGSVTWGLGGTWVLSPMALSAGQYMYQSDGIFDPVANTTKWSVPYWSSLKVGYLSAISADLGTVTAGNITGASFKTSGSGNYVALNEGGNNKLIYYIGGSTACEIGGSSGIIWATSGSSLSSTISGIATGPLNGVTGSAASGNGIAGFSSSGAGVSGTVSSGKGVSGNSSSGGYGGYFTASSGVGLYCSGNQALSVNGVIIQSGTGAANLNSIVPAPGSTLGTAGNPWATAYVTGGAWTGSDRRLKTIIRDSDLGLAFINSLRPRVYKMRVGNTVRTLEPEQAGPGADGLPIPQGVITTTTPGVRDHYGLITQELREALGTDSVAMWALADKDDPESSQYIIYTELIAPMIKAIQELSAEIKTLKAAHA